MKTRSIYCFIGVFFLISCSKNEKIKYSYIGEYDYEIYDSVKFNETYLSKNSLGYTFGDLKIQGINIAAPKKIIEYKKSQYIISLNSPIKKANLNFGCECYPRNYLPLEVHKNESVNNNKVYIYRIDDTRIFKHILP